MKLIFNRVKQFKQFQGSKKKARKKEYEARKKARQWNKNEMARLAEKMGMPELAKKIAVVP